MGRSSGKTWLAYQSAVLPGASLWSSLALAIGACCALRPVAGVCIRGDLPDFCGWVADGSCRVGMDVLVVEALALAAASAVTS